MRYWLASFNIETNTWEKCFPNTDKPNTLEDIVNFTNMFENKFELMIFLLHLGRDINSMQFAIVFEKGETVKILPHGISYCKDKDKFNMNSLRLAYNELIRDSEFLQLFLHSAFGEDGYYEHLQDVDTYRSYLAQLEIYNQNEKTIPKICKAQNEITRFINSYVGAKKPNFRKLRDLTMLAISYKWQDKEAVFIDEEENLQKRINCLQLEIDNYTSITNSGCSTIEQEIYNNKIKEINLELEALRRDLDINNKIRRINNGENTEYQNTRRIPKNT